jgi:hypothetical protein
MKKPLLGDYLNVRYAGAMHRVRCDDITETPSRGAGAANFTIISDVQFQRGQDAQLIVGSDELIVHVDRVSVVGNRRRNIVQLHGVFDAPASQPHSVAHNA